jgi:DNA-binding NarL/FixJ family response regulator
MEHKIRVWVVDDHDIVRDGIKAMFLIDDKIEICAESGSGEEFFATLPESLPDIVLVDLSMPGMPGTAVVSKLRKLHPEIKIIILTGSLNQIIVKDCIDLDIDGFLLKTSSKDILSEAIKKVFDGKQFFDRNISQALVNEYLRMKKRLRKSEKQLTDREEEVVKWLAKGLTHKEIAARLFISKRTVDTHVTHIMEKTGCPTKAEIILFALKIGLVDLYR